MHLVVQREGVAEDGLVAVEGVAEVADASGLALLQEEVEHAVVDEAGVEELHRVLSAAADGVEQVEVDHVGAQEATRLLVHLARLLEGVRLGGEVGKLRGDEPLVARMLRERVAQHLLGLAAAVGGRRVEVVDAAVEQHLHLPVHELLVDVGRGRARRPAVGVLSVHRRQAHRAVSEKRDLVSVCSEPICHLIVLQMVSSTCLQLYFTNPVPCASMGARNRSTASLTADAYETGRSAWHACSRSQGSQV